MFRLRARQRRIFHGSVVVLVLGPGAFLSYIWMHSIPWLVFMSWFSMLYGPLSALSAETPVESEDADTMSSSPDERNTDASVV